MLLSRGRGHWWFAVLLGLALTGCGTRMTKAPVEDRGTAAAVQTNRGTGAVGVQSSSGGGAAAWDTRYGQGAAVKDKEGNVYAGKDGNVYKRDSSGNWSSNTGSGWQSTSRPQSTRELNAQAGYRSRGNQMQRRSR